MAFDFKKFLASGTKPTEAIARGGSRPKGSPKPTVFPGPKDKKKKVVKKKVANTNTRDSKKLITQESVKSGIGRKNQRQFVLKQDPFKRPNYFASLPKKKKVVAVKKEKKIVTPKKITNEKKLQNIEKKVVSSTPGFQPFLRNPEGGRYSYKSMTLPIKMENRGVVVDTKTGSERRLDYTKQKLGSIKQKPSAKTNLALDLTSKYNVGFNKGGITKRRFGGMAKGGFKMPNKVKIT